MREFQLGSFRLEFNLPKISLSHHLALRKPIWEKNREFENILIWLAMIVLILDILIICSWDHRFGFGAVQALSQNLHDDIWAHITLLGDTITALCLFLFFAIRFPHLLYALLLASLLGTGIVHVVKPLLDLPRPAGVLPLEQVHIVGAILKSHSFPSGHTLTAFVTGGLLLRTTPYLSVKILLLLAAAVVGWSRVAVGAHWPIDVLAGAAGGLFSAWAGLKLSDIWLGGNPTRLYRGIFLLLMISAILLFGYDGDFEGTAFFTSTIAICGIAYSAFAMYRQSLLATLKINIHTRLKTEKPSQGRF